MRQRMPGFLTLLRLLIVPLACTAFVMPCAMRDGFRAAFPPSAATSLVWAAQSEPVPDKPDIEWFRDEMRISPKYFEGSVGILGMSWALFMTLVFLIVFFVGTIAFVYLWNRKTRYILTSLLEEEKRNECDSRLQEVRKERAVG